MDWGVWGENWKEVVEIVFEGGWDVARNNPVESLSEKVEDIWCRLEAKGEDDVVIELPLPRVAQEIPVFGADWYVTGRHLSDRVWPGRQLGQGSGPLR